MLYICTCNYIYVTYIFVIQRLTTVYNLGVFRLTTILVAIRICKNEVLWLTGETQFNSSVVGQHLPVLMGSQLLFCNTVVCFNCI